MSFINRIDSRAWY